MLRPALHRLVLASTILLTACSGSSGQEAGRSLSDATAANRALVEQPLCRVASATDLERLGLHARSGVPDDGPIWAGCRWGRPARPRLHVRVSTISDLDRPLLDDSSTEPIDLGAAPLAARAGVIDGDLAPDCSTVMVELIDDQGLIDVAICGPSAPAQARTAGVSIAKDVLDAWR